MITATFASRKDVSSPAFAPAPSGRSKLASQCEANAALPYGKSPVLTCAARYPNSVIITSAIMDNVIHAALVCEP